MKPPKPRSIVALAAEEAAGARRENLATLRRAAWIAVLATQAVGWWLFRRGNVTLGSLLVLIGLAGTAILLGVGSTFRGRTSSWAAAVLLGTAAGFLYAVHRAPGFQWGHDPSFWLAVLNAQVPQPFASPLAYLLARGLLPILPGGSWPDLPLLAAVGMASAWGYLALSSLERVWESGMETRLYVMAAVSAAALTLPAWLSAGSASGLTASLGLLLALMLERMTREERPPKAAALVGGCLFSVHPAWGILGLLLLFRRPGESLRRLPGSVGWYLLGWTPLLWVFFRAGHSLQDWGGLHPFQETFHAWNDLLAEHLAREKSLHGALISLGWSMVPFAAGLLVLGWKVRGAAGGSLRLLAALLGALFFYSKTGAVPGTTALWLPAGLSLWWSSVHRDAAAGPGAWNRALRIFSWVSVLAVIGLSWIQPERATRFMNAAPMRHVENLLVNAEDPAGRRLLLLGEDRFETEGALLLQSRTAGVQRDVIVNVRRLGERWYLEQLIHRENEVLFSVGEGGREVLFPDLVRQNLDRWSIEWAVSAWPESWKETPDRLGFQALPRVLTLRLTAVGGPSYGEDPSARYDLSDILEDARWRGGPAKTVLRRYAAGLYAWGVSQTRAGRYPPAVRVFERSQWIDPDYEEPRRALERLYSEKSMMEAARLQFEQVVKINPVRIRAVEKMLSSGRLSAEEQAARLADKARWAGDLSEALHSLGLIYEKQGRYDDSRRALEEAVKWKPDRAGTQIELARLFLKMGNQTKARAAYRAALEADPENKTAQTELWKMLNRP